MIFVVRQKDGHEFGIEADRMCVEPAGIGRYRLVGTEGVFTQMPSSEFEHVRLSDTLPQPDPRA